MKMPEPLRISLARGVATVSSISDFGLQIADSSPDSNPQSAICNQQSNTHAVEQHSKELSLLCQTVSNLAGKLDRLYQETIAHSHAEIAQLAVEIARKIVMCEVAKGGYDIQAIIEEALKRVPTHQDLIVRVNPDDSPSCQRLQEEHPDSEFAKLQFVGDRSIARANCLIETPKGIVRAFVEEGLERIREALEKSQ
jgi:flagellar biosynthesis/type III secretory pathway protein FliH